MTLLDLHLETVSFLFYSILNQVENVITILKISFVVERIGCVDQRRNH